MHADPTMAEEWKMLTEQAKLAEQAERYEDMAQVNSGGGWWVSSRQASLEERFCFV